MVLQQMQIFIVKAYNMQFNLNGVQKKKRIQNKKKV